MFRIWPVIAQMTFRETIRNRILYNFLAIAVFLVLLSYVISKLTYGYPYRVAMHFGMGAITFSSVLISVFVGANLVSKEIMQRTIFTILSKPVPRGSFLLGKYLGLLGILLVNIFLLACVLVGLLYFLGHEPGMILYQNFILQFFEAALILSIAIFFSSFASPTLATIFSLSLFFAGRGLGGLERLYESGEEGLFVQLLPMLKVFIPDLSRFNIQNIVFYEDPFSWLNLWSQGLYAFLYASICLFFAWMIFSRRDFA
jgi:ABC-type transport system involved in multi-copper enzyme maturation permease subunit